MQRYIYISLICFLTLLPLSNEVFAQVIREIKVEGTQRVEPSTVLSYIDLRVGDNATSSDRNKALKNLFSTGLFADISIDQRGDVLSVRVVENPVINQIAFEGNDKIEDAELQSEIQMRPRQVFTRTKAQSDLSRLYQIYRRGGRFSVNIEPKIIRLDQNRVNVIFEIEEGGVTKVSKVRFIGNEAFSDSQLRGEISTKETRWYRFITADDRYDPDRLTFDQDLLRRFYLSEGYADFRVASAVAELTDDKDRFFITITVDEGIRYRVGSIVIESRIRDFDPKPLYDELVMETGEWYNADFVQETIDNITDKLGDLQYAFVSVRPSIERNREEQTVDIKFTVNETPRVFVERIDVNGNLRTLDKVLRREILMVEGDPFNRSKLARSEQRLRNLDFFETIDVTTKPGSAPDKTIIEVNVTEKSTGELSIGAGFSTNDGPLADFGIRERNLLGKGQDLSLSSVIAGERTEFDISFTEPYFLNRDVSAGFDLFHITRDFQDESSFDQTRTGGGLRLGYPLSERWRQTLRLRGERNEISNVDDDASRFVADQEGERDTFAAGQRLVYDNRNSRINPSEGVLYWLDTEVAGLGGDAKYVSGKTGASYFHPFFRNNLVLNVLGEVGAIEGYGDEDVQINERYFIGGSTLRGFERGGIGPRDLETNDSLGGNIFYRGSVELSFPLGLSEELGIRGHAFTDAGSLFEIDEPSDTNLADESSIRAAAGVGMSWQSPFGPLRLDFALPIAEEDFDETESFRFDFGTRF